MGSLKSCKHYHWLTILAILVAALVAMLGGCGAATTTTAATSEGTAPTTTTAASATDAPDATPSEPVSGTIVVKGMVDNPMTLTAEAMHAMDPVTITATHPKMGDQEYTGVRLGDLFTTLEVQSTATKSHSGREVAGQSPVPRSLPVRHGGGGEGLLPAVLPRRPHRCPTRGVPGPGTFMNLVSTNIVSMDSTYRQP